MPDTPFANDLMRVLSGIGLMLFGAGMVAMWRTSLRYMLVPISAGILISLASMVCLLLNYQQFSVVGMVKFLAGIYLEMGQNIVSPIVQVAKTTDIGAGVAANVTTSVVSCVKNAAISVATDAPADITTGVTNAVSNVAAGAAACVTNAVISVATDYTPDAATIAPKVVPLDAAGALIRRAMADAPNATEASPLKDLQEVFNVNINIDPVTRNPDFVYTLYVYGSLAVVGMVIGLIGAWFPSLAKYIGISSLGAAISNTFMMLVGLDNKYVKVGITLLFMIAYSALVFIYVPPPLSTYMHLVGTHLLGWVIFFAGMDCITQLGFDKMFYFILDSAIAFEFSFGGFGMFFAALIIGLITCALDVFF